MLRITCAGPWARWFIEVLVQILVVSAFVFCVPAVRSTERRWPFGFALALLAGALVFRFDLLTLGDPTRYIFRPHTVVWLFLWGGWPTGPPRPRNGWPCRRWCSRACPASSVRRHGRW